MDKQVDHGSIIQSVKYKIEDAKLTYEELSKQLAVLGAELIIKTVPQFLKRNNIPYSPRSFFSYCQKDIAWEDEKIKWNETNIQIDRKVRALNPQPGVFTKAINPQGNELILKIIKGYPENNESLEQTPGKFLIFKIKWQLDVIIRILCHWTNKTSWKTNNA